MDQRVCGKQNVFHRDVHGKLGIGIVLGVSVVFYRDLGALFLADPVLVHVSPGLQGRRCDRIQARAL